MTYISAYLNFNGQCREAMTFYQQCLGGELNLQKVSESPMAARMPSELGAHILHGTLVKDNIVLMGSDMRGAGLVNGNSVGLCLHCSSDEELNACFDSLSRGGLIVTPLHQTFRGATYGEITDKYGMNWMLDHSKD